LLLSWNANALEVRAEVDGQRAMNGVDFGIERRRTRTNCFSKYMWRRFIYQKKLRRRRYWPMKSAAHALHILLYLTEEQLLNRSWMAWLTIYGG